jgi:peptidoglycan/xylan/chitin deacetylase (PgdA/CDA1 family)
MTPSPFKLALSVDVDEWFHSRRWVDGHQGRDIPDLAATCRRLYGQDRPAGEVIGPTLALLDLFGRYHCRCTFFLLGEVAEWYPQLVVAIAERGHEIACHGMHHVDMTILGPDRFARDLARARDLLASLTGAPPVGFRGPNLVFEPWATAVLEDLGFVYDSTVCASRSIGGKYKGWANAPTHPYRPSYDTIATPGDARLVELPIPAFPVLKLAAGSGIMTRVIGFRWTMTALTHAIRSGHTVFYFHPWEVGPRPHPRGHRLRNAVFLRHTGEWMMGAVERLLQRFHDRIVPARTLAEEAIDAQAAARSSVSAPAMRAQGVERVISPGP